MRQAGQKSLVWCLSMPSLRIGAAGTFMKGRPLLSMRLGRPLVCITGKPQINQVGGNLNSLLRNADFTTTGETA